MYTEVNIIWKSFVNLSESTQRQLVSKIKKMTLITKEQQESYENEKICYNCKETFEKK